MVRALVLNATYEPLAVVTARRAVVLVLAEKADSLDGSGQWFHAERLALEVPSVIRLRTVVRVDRHRELSISRRGVLARDEHRCQYCGNEFDPARLTFDHVVPVARGGLKTWENIVTCCIECNRRKGDRLPEERGMKLVRKPRRPDLPRALALIFSNRFAHPTWRDYLYFGRRSQATYGGLA